MATPPHLGPSTPGGRAPSRLLVICPAVPHPSAGASTVLFFWYIAGALAAGYRVHVLLMPATQPSDAQLSSFTQALPNPELTWQVETGLLKTSQRWLALDQGDVGTKRIATAVAEHHPDCMLCLDLASAWAAAPVAVPRRVAWLGDLTFQTAACHARYACSEGKRPWISLPITLLRARAWRQVYRRILPAYDAVIVASASSVPALEELGVHSSYMPYPWPCDPPAPRTPPVLPTFVCMGTFDALGGRSTFHVLFGKLYDSFVQRFGRAGFCIRICGRGEMPVWAMRALSTRPELEFAGFVPDLPTFLASCHALLAPIEVAVGNRSRILTAMAQKLPVVAHENTRLGNPDLIHGQTCLLAGSAVGLASEAARIASDAMLAHTLAEQAYRTYQQQFSPTRAAAALIRVVSGT